MFPTRRIATMSGDVFRDEYSLAFDGSNDNIRTPDITVDTDGACAIVFWAKYTGGGSSPWCVLGNTGDSGSKHLRFVGTDDLKWENDTTNEESVINLPTAFTDLQWHHYVVVSSSGTVTAYQDGVACTIAGDNLSSSNCTFNSIGGQGTGGASNTLNGNISEIAIYNKALSASEAKTLYNGREPYNHKEGVCASNLQAWWRMGDGSLDKFGTSNGVIGSITDVSIGPELLVDTGFDNASYWDTPGNITVNDSSNSKAVFTNDANNTRLDPDDDVNAVAGRVYKAVFTIDSISEGALKFNIGGVDGTSRNSAGTYTEYILATGTGYIYLRTSGETSATIDNISVKQLGVNAGVMVNMDAVDIVGDTP